MGCFISRGEEDQSIATQGEVRKLKVVMVGLEGSGKTSILYYMKNQKFTPTSSTIGLNVETVTFQSKTYLIFDVGGKVRTLWSHYYESLDALIFVIDSSDKAKLYTVKDELKILNKQLEYQTVLILIFFAKWDLVENPDTQLLVEETNIIIQQCSAKTGEGIWDGIQKLTNFLDNHIKRPKQIMQTNGH